MQKRLFWGLFLINFSVTLGFGLTDTFFSIYLVSLGAQGALFASSISAYSGAKIVCAPLIGFALEHWGQRVILSLSLFVFLLVSCGYLFSSNLYMMVLLRLLQGVACAIFRPVVLDLLQQILPENCKSKILGTFDISFYCALGLGQLIGGTIKLSWGFHGLFIALNFFCLLALGLYFYTSPSLPSKKPCTNGTIGPAQVLKNMIFRRPFIALLLYIFGRSYGISVLIVFFPILLANQIGLDDAKTGLIMGMSTLTLIFLLRRAGRLVDYISPRASIALGGIAAAVILLIIPATESFPQALILMITIGISTSVSQPATTSLLVEEGRLLGMGHTAGLFNTVMNLGFICGSLMGTGLLKYFGLCTVFLSAAALGVLSTLAFLSLSSINNERIVTTKELRC